MGKLDSRARTFLGLLAHPATSVHKFGYVPVLAVSMALTMGRGLILARLLTIWEFSTYSLGLLISGTYCMLVCLGLQPLLQREMPVNIVRGCGRRGVVGLVQCELVAIACVFVCILAANIVMNGVLPTTVFIGLFHGLSQQLFAIVTVESRSRRELQRFAWQNFVRGALFIGIASAVASASGSADLVLLSEALATVVCVVPVMIKIVRRVDVGIYGIYLVAFKRLRKVDWKAATILFLVSLIVFLLFSVDRWLANRFLTTEDFGLYSFAAIVLVMGGALQALINAFVYPALATKYALEGVSAVYRSSATLSIILLIGGLLISVPSYYLLVRVIREFFPQYLAVDGILFMFLIAGSVRVSDFWSSYLIITKRERALLVVNMTTVVVGLLIWGGAVHPWRGAVSLSDIALLAAILSILNICLLIATTIYVANTNKASSQ